MGKKDPLIHNGLEYQWLEYSKEQDAAFCFPFHLFVISAGLKKGVNTITEIGYSDWKQATGESGMLFKHNNSSSHKQAMSTWKDYMTNSKKGLLIDNRAHMQRQKAH